MRRKSVVGIAMAAMRFATISEAEQFDGKMNCQVKTNTVIEIEEGLPSTYTGIEDRFEVGDTLELTYEFGDSLPEFYLSLEDVKRGIPVTYSYVGGDDLLEAISAPKRSDILVFEDDFSQTSFGKDYIRIEVIGHPELRLTRYYKSDWQGIASGFIAAAHAAQIYTLDCRTVSGDIDNTLEALFELSTNENYGE